MNERPGRLAALDALRGIASVWVACSHIFCNSLARPVLEAHLPWAISACFVHGGHLGVAIFFVLSGFVIAYSTFDAEPSGRFALEFTARRSLRLDPPYWLVLAAVASLNALSNVVITDRVAAVPGVAQFVQNMFYLQVFGFTPGILGVAWTLCLEVQFYLVFIASVWIGTAMLPRVGAGRRAAARDQRAGAVVLAPLLCWSLVLLLMDHRATSNIGYWYAFSGGVLACWSMRTSMSIVPPLAVAAVAMFAAWLRGHNDPAMVALVIGVMVAGGQRGWLYHSGGRWLQRLGAWSYSLYLVHTVVGAPVQDLGYRIAGNSFPLTVLWAAIALGASLLAAALMRRFVELPSIQVASRLKGWHLRPVRPVLDCSTFSRRA